jgi:pimeloyl-ACP methyl ester carboxylesterase
MRNRITLSLLETIRVPTLVITGGADMYAPPPVMRLFARRVKNSELSPCRMQGTQPIWEQPEVFNRAVIDFIRKN